MSTPEKRNPEIGRETKDANVRSIFKYGIGFIVVGLIAHVLMFFLFRFLAEEAKKKDPSLSPLAPKQLQLPPQPRLQAEVVNDRRQNQPFDPLLLRKELQKSDDRLLTTYGWVNRTNGTVRIPIDQAIKIMLKRNPQNPGQKQNAIE